MQDFQSHFLIEFTRELIKNSDKGTIIELKDMIKREEKLIPKKIKEEVPEKKENIKDIISIPAQRVLKVPRVKIPATIKYLENKEEINFGKIDTLIKNPLVKTIECEGPEEKLIVDGTKGKKTIDLSLSEEEIKRVIKEFSELSEKPIGDIFNATVGNLEINAIVSDIAGSKFIIKKKFPTISFNKF